jgi:hypothetical protein
MYAIIRHAKLHTVGNLTASGEHTFRERDTPNADPEMTKHNSHYLAQNTAELVENVKSKLPEKVRKNGVICLEYLVTASPEFFVHSSAEKRDDYFREAREWLVQRHGEKNIAYVGIQLDESTPHMVAYVVPIDPKGRLNASHFTGSRMKLSEYQDSFANAVEQFGLKRGIKGSKAQHQQVKRHYGMINQALNAPTDIAALEAGYAQAITLRAENEALKAQLEALKPKPIVKWKSKAKGKLSVDPFSDAPKEPNTTHKNEFEPDSRPDLSSNLENSPKTPRNRF